MERSFRKALKGYQRFREKYAHGDSSVMQMLSVHGQQPKIMVVACCDSRVDPALILQCDPGDLFVVRNVANIIPPYEKDKKHHGTSAALEFGIRFLKVKHLIVLGHSQCGGIQALLQGASTGRNDFITSWVFLIKPDDQQRHTADGYAKLALKKSYEHCMTFPWIELALNAQELAIHLWFFDIKTGKIFTYEEHSNTYRSLKVIEEN